MNTLQTVSIISLFIMQLLIPVLLIAWIGFRRSKSRINLLLKLLASSSFFFYIFYAANWSFLPYILRYILLALMVAAAIKALIPFKTMVFWEKKKVGAWSKCIVQSLFATLFLFASIDVIKGFSAKEQGIDIAFPLKEGFISQGGNAIFINYHNEDTTAQQYALDITQLNAWGMRASGFFPLDLTRYAIYGDTVFAPCDGQIVKTRDGLDNVPVGTENRLNPAGNHFVLKYQNNLIVFAHLLKNSLLVQMGNFVKKGQPIARVGNSGNTSEPHLHIHAISGTDTAKIIRGEGNGIPIYFDGKFLTRNDIVKMKK